MWIGIDDTDSPQGMCTTYLGAVLIGRLLARGFGLTEARLIRLNPNVPYKTRGNAAISLEVEGDPEIAFSMACRCVEDLADLPADGTEPGVVVSGGKPPVSFYHKALRSFCETDEAVAILDAAGALYKGWKGGRGLIGATAAIASDLPDSTWELLVYRKPAVWGSPREIDRETFFLADAATSPGTWDTVDRENDIVVCSPHTPDPVLFGIRGQTPLSVALARTFIRTEPAWPRADLSHEPGDRWSPGGGRYRGSHPGPLIPPARHRGRESSNREGRARFPSPGGRGI